MVENFGKYLSSTSGVGNHEERLFWSSEFIVKGKTNNILVGMLQVDINRFKVFSATSIDM